MESGRGKGSKEDNDQLKTRSLPVPDSGFQIGRIHRLLKNDNYAKCVGIYCIASCGGLKFASLSIPDYDF